MFCISRLVIQDFELDYICIAALYLICFRYFVAVDSRSNMSCSEYFENAGLRNM